MRDPTCSSHSRWPCRDRDAVGGVASSREWSTAVIARGKQPAHATLVPYATIEQASSGPRGSPFLPLAKRPLEVPLRRQARRPPARLLQADFDDRGWAEIVSRRTGSCGVRTSRST